MKVTARPGKKMMYSEIAYYYMDRKGRRGTRFMVGLEAITNRGGRKEGSE
jgi:hypothetical protein